MMRSRNSRIKSASKQPVLEKQSRGIAFVGFAFGFSAFSDGLFALLAQSFSGSARVIQFLFIASICLYWMLLGDKNRNGRRNLDWAVFAILPISLTVWIGHLHTISPEYGSYKAQLFARPVILYCGACYLCSIGQTFRPILKGTYLGVLVSRALIVGVGKSYVDDGIAGEFSRGVFGEPIGASSDFALLALLSLLLFYKRRPIVAIMLVAAFLLLILATGTRGPVLACLLACAVYIFYTRRNAIYGFTYVALALPLILFLPLLVSTFGKITFVRGGIDRVFSFLHGSIELSRLEYWEASLRLFAENPLFGGGLGSFAMHFKGVDERVYSHNVLLEISSELGLVGLVSFSVILIKPMMIWMRAGAKTKSMTLPLLVLGALMATFSNDLPNQGVLFFAVGLCNSWNPRRANLVSRPKAARKKI